MKNIIQILFFFFTVSQIHFSQWIQTNGPYGGYVNCFTISGTNLFAGTNNGIFLSTNEGNSWIKINNNSIDDYILALASKDTYLFACSGWSGVFRSTDNGTSWIEVLGPSNNTSFQAFAINDTNLFVGAASGNGGGVFILPIMV